jgi:hypothetical protein
MRTGRRAEIVDHNGQQALKRLRRKLEILLLDCKRLSDTKHYDMEECLALLEIIERTINAGNHGENKESLGSGPAGADAS